MERERRAKKKANARSGRELSYAEKKIIGLLGLPTFGLALAITVVVTYVPLIARQFTTSTAIVGLIIATEGVVALILPVIAGGFSDHLKTKIGGRLPFLLAGLPFSAVALLLMGVADSMAELIVYVILFFIAYYLAYEPYRALYPDIVSNDAAGRSQSAQAVWRGAGTGLALGGGGFLFAAEKWLPFTVAAILVVASTGLFFYLLLKRHGVPPQHRKPAVSIKENYLESLKLLKSHGVLRSFVVANMLWEAALGALKSFILLYITLGLGKSKTEAAIVIAVSSVIMLGAAAISGKIADKLGRVRTMQYAAAIFGLMLLVPFITTRPLFILLILPVGAFGGATVLSLPYAILMPMMPSGRHGRLTGIYSTSRGLGIMLGPVLAGGAISLGRNLFTANGYAAMWLVCSACMLLSLPLLGRMRLEHEPHPRPRMAEQTL